MRKVAGALVAAFVLAAPVHAATTTTERRTIADLDGDNRLEPAPGDDHLLRDDLGEKTPDADPVELKFFAQITDTHVVDEESPLRVEWLDKFGQPFVGAYRPQEGLSAHVLEAMVRQVRFTNSPVTGRPIDLVMTTGDNTDNTQCNETRWMIDLMDGDTAVNPDSGIESPTELSAEALCRPDAPAEQYTPGCDVQSNDSIYDGVRNSNEYYEPDSSTEPGADNEDGAGYSPDQAENEREAQRRTALRDFPGLFETMNTPFQATGLQDLPWYGIFGNHDGLVQGNQPRNPALEGLAVGCTKVTGLSGSAPAPSDFGDVPDALLTTAAEGDPSLTQTVPPDPRRRPLKKSEYIAEHFNTTGVPVGHGFTAENVETGMGNYSFSPNGDERLRFIVLDSISEHGLDDGNIDDTQFQWLHGELSDADSKKQLAVVFAHHSLRTMGQPPVSPFAPGDTGGNLSPNVHFGEGPRGSQEPTPCATDDPAAPAYPTETVRCLFLRHRSVIAFVNGHEHASRITPYERHDGTGRAEGGFWEINTASHIDWPQQARVIDIVDNQDGSLSIWATMVDHAGSADPGGAPARSDGQGQTGPPVQRLASISRELSFNEPDGGTGEDSSDWRGGEQDRNVELVVRDPR